MSIAVRILLRFALGAGLIVLALVLLRLAFGWNGELDHARSEIYAAQLGDHAYVAGGIGLFRTLSSCEKINFDTLEASACAPLPRAVHHVALASDGRYLYASGGYTALPFEPDQDPALWRYDPVGDAWTRIDDLPETLGQHTMHHRDGKLYLLGGRSGLAERADLKVFDIATDEWSKLDPMPTPRSSHAATIHDSSLYVSGGRNDARGSALTDVLRYDFALDRWERLPDMPAGRAGHGMVAMNGSLHVIGGEDLDSSQLTPRYFRFDLSGRVWSEQSGEAVQRHGLAVVADERSRRAIAIGGGARPGIETIYSVTGTVTALSLD